MESRADQRPILIAGMVVRGSLFPEPVQVIICTPLGESVKLVGKGLDSGRVYEPILDAAQVASLQVSPAQPPFDGTPLHFRLGVEALRLALAYEYDPYFSLSIARVDPLPHQLEAVHEYFIKLPRIRFLLADDPGAGKTIMAGLLLKELKIRGLVKRTLNRVCTRNVRRYGSDHRQAGSVPRATTTCSWIVVGLPASTSSIRSPACGRIRPRPVSTRSSARSKKSRRMLRCRMPCSSTCSKTVSPTVADRAITAVSRR